MKRKLCSVFVCAISALQAQNITGTILGTVTDKSGAPIPNAAVTINNNATNQSKRATTNSDGYYEATYLPPGTYSTQVAKEGFKTAVHRDVSLQVESRLRIDVVLEIGDAATS